MGKSRPRSISILANQIREFCSSQSVLHIIMGNIGPRSFLYGPRCARSVLPRPRANISLAVRPSRSVSKKLLRGHPEVIPAEALWLTGPYTFVRRNRSFSEVKNLATGLKLFFLLSQPRENRGKSAIAKKCFFFSKNI